MKFSLKQNMGMLDRVPRICLGAILLFLATTVIGGTVGTVLVMVSASLLITGITGFCPTYVLLGISTNRAPECPRKAQV